MFVPPPLLVATEVDAPRLSVPAIFIEYAAAVVFDVRKFPDAVLKPFTVTAPRRLANVVVIGEPEVPLLKFITGTSVPVTEKVVPAAPSVKFPLKLIVGLTPLKLNISAVALPFAVVQPPLNVRVCPLFVNLILRK